MTYTVTYIVKKPEGAKWFHEEYPGAWQNALNGQAEMIAKTGRVVDFRFIDDNTLEQTESYPDELAEQTFAEWRILNEHFDLRWQHSIENNFVTTSTITIT